MLIYVICALIGAKNIFLHLNKCIIYAKLMFFDKNSVGSILSRISNDI